MWIMSYYGKFINLDHAVMSEVVAVRDRDDNTEKYAIHFKMVDGSVCCESVHPDLQSAKCRLIEFFDGVK